MVDLPGGTMSMKVTLALLLLFVAVCRGQAQDLLTGVSPDGKFGVLSNVNTRSARLVALPSRQTLVETLIDSQGEAPSMLWSKDIRRLFCWLQQARFTTYSAYQQTDGSFTELSLPRYELPIERKLRNKLKDKGEENLLGARWLDGGGLVIDRAGIIRLIGKSREAEDKTEVDYAYEVTFSFDRRGTGRVARIVKSKS